ncbi:MAG TPA: ABC transporter permease, partial [Clostridia bacterium]|nr:ABC transporter permease [Clostridia bacterium]
MLKYIFQKLAFTILVLIGAATCSFLLLHAIPGDTAEALAGPQATLEDVENLRKAMKLDAPLTEQYLLYMSNLIHGDLGHSYRTNKPVWSIVAQAWPA